MTRCLHCDLVKTIDEWFNDHDGTTLDNVVEASAVAIADLAKAAGIELDLADKARLIMLFGTTFLNRLESPSAGQAKH